MSRLAKLIEQTQYLLLKQHEAQTQTEAIFSDVLSFIEKSAETKPEAHKDRLMEVYELLSARAETINHYAQEDIDFLKDQLKALDAIKAVADPKAAAEMLSSLVDEDEEVLETPEFKEQLHEELEQSKQVLSAVMEDIKEAVSRNDIKETEILIESMLEAEEMDEDGDEDYDDEDEDEDDDFDDEDEEDEDENPRPKKRGGCGDCTGGCGPKGGCSSGAGSGDDFFSFMSKYDRDLEEDDEDVESDTCCADEDEEEDDECCGK